ncbi:hypothetical protein HYH03_018243 [Edaphochlamys debaryana]|uniref:beta-carotene 3-hydroxylase n=1 Tax=Edaphochlamys debaryana TaxID=47281 RepID=A0A835XE58_9CHLO|nr:hypothetical protein HYH03_018243 [Edaphochlamys debaryana]|eukprot:KAG2482852.1 hypothetical protein HYH03_018243 [Edaphochlamys debaryana]
MLQARIGSVAPSVARPRPLRPIALAARPGHQFLRLQPVNVANPLVEAPSTVETAPAEPAQPVQEKSAFELARIERAKQRKKEQLTYQVTAIAASALVISIAIIATYYRFVWHADPNADLPWDQIAATLLLVCGGVFGMEMYARFAHKVLWHDWQPGWALHKSHHEPRLGPFELNDIYAVANAVPAIALCYYGFVTPNLLGGICFGAGLGITLFGMSYMFFHDGLVHRRFPVGPIADVPYMKRAMIAHQIHHTDKFGGVPFGMFLGPMELDAVPGGREELERLLADLEAREAEAREKALADSVHH